MSRLLRIGVPAWIAFVLFGVALLPLPAVTAAYDAWLRFQTRLVFAEDDARHPVVVEEIAPGRSKVVVGRAGNVATSFATLNHRTLGWLPTAAYLALFLAFVRVIRQRLRRFAVGFALTSSFVILRVSIPIAMAWSMHASRCAERHWFALSDPTCKRILGVAHSILVVDTSLLLLAPVLIWGLTAFPASSWKALLPFPSIASRTRSTVGRRIRNGAVGSD